MSSTWSLAAPPSRSCANREAKSVAPRGTEHRLGWQCLALEVDDIDAALDMLGQNGVPAAWGPVRRADYARAEILDPEGNPIELRQWYRR